MSVENERKMKIEEKKLRSRVFFFSFICVLLETRYVIGEEEGRGNLYPLTRRGRVYKVSMLSPACAVVSVTSQIFLISWYFFDGFFLRIGKNWKFSTIRCFSSSRK